MLQRRNDIIGLVILLRLPFKKLLSKLIFLSSLVKLILFLVLIVTKSHKLPFKHTHTRSTVSFLLLYLALWTSPCEGCTDDKYFLSIVDDFHVSLGCICLKQKIKLPLLFWKKRAFCIGVLVPIHPSEMVSLGVDIERLWNEH